MPVTVSYPGVYIEEASSGVHTITGVATSITAFVGYASKGPLDKAVRIFNFGDYVRNFGGLNRDSEIAYAVQQFFLNGGADAYVVRVALGAQPAQITLCCDGGTTPVLDIIAKTAGQWGNKLRMDVDYATSNPDSTFNLTVARYELQGSEFIAVEQEIHRNLSMNSNSSSYAPSVVTAASKLINVKRSAGVTYNLAGYSLSGNLGSFPTMTTSEVALKLIVDGTDTIDLLLASPPTGIGDAVTKINAAITTAGAGSRLKVERTDAPGTSSATGDYIKISSNDTTERSSVQIIPAPSNDASTSLTLGLAKGGRETDGASNRRPLPTGTTSADLTEKVGTNVGGKFNVVINDNTTGSVVALFNGAVPTFTLTPTAVGQELADAMQTELRKVDHATTRSATVRYVGTTLQVIPSADTPNASIVLSGTGAGATATKLSGTGSFVNVQQYSLGVGAAFGAQKGQQAGADGMPPDAMTLIGNYDDKTGLYALRNVDLFNLLVIPRTAQMQDTESKSVMAAAVAFCNERRAFYIVDPKPDKTWSDIGQWVTDQGISERNAAIFFPSVQTADPLNGYRPTSMPPSGTIAGIFSRTDASHGVWKAPAGTEATLKGVQALDQVLTDQENGVLNPLGINCLRSFPVYGRVIWGARTLRGADQLTDDYKYVPVRRLALYIEESLYRGTKWVVFEPNDEPLWAQIRLNVGVFMNGLFRQGAFQGSTPDKAFYVKCDSETTTQADRNLGIVNIEVGFAPLKPAEFVVITIQQIAGNLQ